MVKNKRGLTYLEVIISLVILLFLFTLFLKYNTSLNHMKYQAQQKEQLIYVAQSVIEIYKSQGKSAAQSYNTEFNIVIKDTLQSNGIKTKLLVTVTNNNNISVTLGDYILNSNIIRTGSKW